MTENAIIGIIISKDNYNAIASRCVGLRVPEVISAIVRHGAKDEFILQRAIREAELHG